MKVQEVILKAMAGSLKWWEAAEIIGISDRSLRRWRERYEEFGYDGLFDRRKKRPSPKRVPVKTVEQVLQLYREQYFDFNVRHFHEKLVEDHGIKLSYTWVKKALQEAGLVQSRSGGAPTAGAGRGGRSRACCCTSTRASTRGFRTALLRPDHDPGRCDERGLLRATGGGRGHSHGHGCGAGRGGKTRLVRDAVQRPGNPLLSHAAGRRQGGREQRDAARAGAQGTGDPDDAGVFATGPRTQERNYRTWQGRLPQELRVRGISDVADANRFLREEYLAEFNRRFTVPAAAKGTAFVRLRRRDLDWVFSIQYQRRVNNDNTVTLFNRVLQIPKTKWRNTLAGSTVTVYEQLDGSVVVRYGPREVARFAAGELPEP